MFVEITQAHIDASVPRDGSGCPIALALEREGVVAVVDPSPIRMGILIVKRGCVGLQITNSPDNYEASHRYETYFLTDAANTLALRFDAGEKIEPCTLEVWEG